MEIDVTNESLGKLPIYAALGVREIWHYDGSTVSFYELNAGIPSRRRKPSFTGLTPAVLADALEQSKTAGQTAALRAFRGRWGS